MGFSIFWGDYLRDMRKQNHLTQKEVASILHVTRQTYSNFETGRNHPSPEVIMVLSNIYETNMFDHVRNCMPTVYLEEQHQFKDDIKTGTLFEKRRAEKKLRAIYRDDNYPD